MFDEHEKSCEIIHSESLYCKTMKPVCFSRLSVSKKSMYNRFYILEFLISFPFPIWIVFLSWASKKGAKEKLFIRIWTTAIFIAWHFSHIFINILSEKKNPTGSQTQRLSFMSLTRLTVRFVVLKVEEESKKSRRSCAEARPLDFVKTKMEWRLRRILCKLIYAA